ncbi:MAG TPA: DUF488 family protein [Arthrobacter sp.]|nr:DUF488 family protein [Arthrobacter sp.]
MAHGNVHVARIYDDAEGTKGKRVLVDRVWPRGIKKEDARLDDWLKDVAPSTDLRKWYGHDPERFEEFKRRYREELDSDTGKEAFEHLQRIAGKGAITLLSASKDLNISQARVLADLLAGSR